MDCPTPAAHRMRQTRGGWLARGALWALLLAGCTGVGDGAPPDGDVPTIDIFIDAPAALIATTTAATLTGLTSCGAECPAGEAAFGYCPDLRAPVVSGTTVTWLNRATGTAGLSAPVYIAGHCSCLLSQCWTSYSARWMVTVPLAMGRNDIDVQASGADGATATDSVTLTRLPAAVAALTATPGSGQVTVEWSTPGASAGTTYNLYWSTSMDVTPVTGSRITNVASPFVHAPLSEATTHYYVVTTLVDGVESAASPLAFATPGWRIEAAATPAGYPRCASLAVDAAGFAHIHYVFEWMVNGFPSRYGRYATNAAGTWTSSPVGEPNSQSCSIALDSVGQVHVSYLDPGSGLVHATRAASTGIWAVQAVDAGAFWVESLVLDVDDHVHLVYPANVSTFHLRLATDRSGAWTTTDLRAMPSLAVMPYVHQLAIAVDAAGGEHVAFAQAGASPGLFHASAAGGAWAVTALDTEAVRELALALDPDGNPHVIYATHAGVLRHARRVAGIWSFDVIADTGYPRFPSLAFGRDGRAHLGFIDASAVNGTVRYANDAGGRWTFSTIDQGDGGTAVAVDRDGFAHLSYLGANGAVVYATRR